MTVRDSAKSLVAQTFLSVRGKRHTLGTDKNVCATFPYNLNRAKLPTLIERINPFPAGNSLSVPPHQELAMARVTQNLAGVFAVVVLSSLIGCGSGDKAGDDKEGNAQPISKRILGNWEGSATIDDASLQKFMKEKNIPEDQAARMKERMQEDKLVFAFNEDGTGKAGTATGGRVDLDDIEWKIQNESDNHAEIVIIDKARPGKDATLDVTFQEDGTVNAKIIPPEEEKGSMPDFTIKLKKIDKLPEETAAKTPAKTFDKTPDAPREID